MSEPTEPGSAPASQPGYADPHGPPPSEASTPASGQAVAADDGVLPTAVGVVLSPMSALGHVTARPRIGGALGVALVVLALTSIAGAADARVEAGGLFGVGGEGVAVAGAAASTLLGLGALALGALIVAGAARLLGGSGSYAATFCGMAFALVPWALTVVLPLLESVTGFAGRLVGGVLTVVVAVWATALAVLAVRLAHHLTTGRAVIATLAPVLALAVLIGLPFALVVVILLTVAALA